MRAIGGTRIEWEDIPPAVRSAVEDELGASVVRADNQPGGFSPGLAARCVLADGRRIFLKAVSPAQNPHSCRIHRREAEVAADLPDSVPHAPLRHVHDDGEWVVLGFDEVAGRQPTEPWTLEELDRVIPAVRALGRTRLAPDHGLQSVVQRHRPVFQGWRRLAGGDGDAGVLDDWARARLDLLAELESDWEEAAAGEVLIHADLRADNMLLDQDGAVTFVDWPWACVGAPFVDLAFFLPSVGLGGGPDPAAVIDRYGLLHGVDPHAFLAVSVAVAGFLQRSSLDPPPPGLPALRSFQQAQADVSLAWLRATISA